MLKKLGYAILVVWVIGLWVYMSGVAIGFITTILGPTRLPFLIEHSLTISLLTLLVVSLTIRQIRQKKP